jgi:hypothetical protein
MNDPGPLPAFLDRTKLVHSYTSLHTYDDVCPHQYYHKFILKDLPFEKTPAMEFGNKVHTAMELRVGTKKPLHPDFAHWECFAKPFDGMNPIVEAKAGISETGAARDFWDKDVWLRGRIDVLVISDKAAFINDWKTTNNPKYQDRFELDVGALMVHAANPALTAIRGTYTFLKQNQVSEIYDLTDTRATWNKVQNIVKNIERDRARGEFEKRQGPLCGFCDVEKCQYNRKYK